MSTKKNLSTALAALLEQHGWTSNDGTAIATKTHATAVGPKEALAYLADYGPGTDTYFLCGEYRSEGNNILVTCFELLPKCAQAASLATLVERFATRCDALVAESYAARLLRIGAVSA